MHMLWSTVVGSLVLIPGTKTNWFFEKRWHLKRGSIDMEFSMRGQDKGDLLIQVTAE
jgi:hypothetical protein